MSSETQEECSRVSWHFMVLLQLWTLALSSNGCVDKYLSLEEQTIGNNSENDVNFYCLHMYWTQTGTCSLTHPWMQQNNKHKHAGTI